MPDLRRARAFWQSPIALAALPLFLVLGCDPIAINGNEPTDVNGDGVVDILDVSLVSSCQGLDPATDANCRNADVDGDGDVDAGDLDAVTTSFTCAIDHFPNGVAAGDVDQSSVVLWARAESAGPVRFEWSRDPDFSGAPDGFRDLVVSDPEIAAKVDDVSGLLPGTQYFYRACRGDACPPSPASGCEARGSFRTPFADDQNGLRFGVSSCFRGDLRPFDSISNVPARDLDFFVALGDTVYADQAAQRCEGCPGGSGSIEEYRAFHDEAYSATKVDGVPQDDNMYARARASTAFFVTIDDHEVVDNFAGAANPLTALYARSNPFGDQQVFSNRPFCECRPDDFLDPEFQCLDANCGELFTNRTTIFENALQTFTDYNPIRDERYGSMEAPRTRNQRKLYRYRTFGRDAAMFMLDARSFRDEGNYLLRWDSGRTMLGQAQLDDLLSDLRSAEDAGITWKFILVPEPIQNLSPDPITAADRFEGYAHERGVILDFIETECIANVVFISGDIHASVANNLVYKKSRFDLQRYSASWDISTGPVAYESPLGASLTGAASGESRDSLFKAELDALLTLRGRPRTGLGLDDLDPLRLQQRNRNIPATLLQGFTSAYVSGHTYGWTEFEIHPTTQKLLVTTYGIDWYKPGQAPGDQDPFIVSQFEVATSCACQKLVCLEDGECCENSVCNLLGGDGTGELLPTCVRRASLENGELCSRNDVCQSNTCILGVCGGCQNVGEVCGEAADCCEDRVCSTLACVGPDSLPALVPCSTDEACRSGNCSDAFVCEQICGDGFCDGTERCGANDVSGLQCRSDCGQCLNGSLCADDSMCSSGLCNGGLCTFPQENGSICVRDDGCQSGLCNAGICTAPLPNGSICVRDEGCQSGLCDLALCTALNSRAAFSPCFSGDACRSGSCTAGTCAQICGDGFCDGTEQCGVLRPLSCTSDCNLCSAGTVCVGDVDCVDGACNFLSCTAPLGNGSFCSGDSSCQSGRCFAGRCAAANCRLPTQVCTSNGQCCTGQCRSIALAADRCF